MTSKYTRYYFEHIYIALGFITSITKYYKHMLLLLHSQIHAFIYTNNVENLSKQFVERQCVYHTTFLSERLYPVHYAVPFKSTTNYFFRQYQSHTNWWWWPHSRQRLQSIWTIRCSGTEKRLFVPYWYTLFGNFSV